MGFPIMNPVWDFGTVIGLVGLVLAWRSNSAGRFLLGMGLMAAGMILAAFADSIFPIR